MADNYLRASAHRLMVKEVKLLRPIGRQTQLNILPQTFVLKFNSGLIAVPSFSHSASDDVAVMTVDARKRLSKVESAKHLHLRKRT